MQFLLFTKIHSTVNKPSNHSIGPNHTHLYKKSQGKFNTLYNNVRIIGPVIPPFLHHMFV